jgi:cytidyltransferase-like protein
MMELQEHELHESIALYLECVERNGITKKQYASLPIKFQAMLYKKGPKYHLSPLLRRKFKVVLSGGVFDIIHPGHVFTLCEAKKHGDVLIVVVATDRTVRKVKKRKPMHNEEARRELVEALKPVDLAIVGVKNWKLTYNRVKPDAVVFGYDQNPLPIRN